MPAAPSAEENQHQPALLGTAPFSASPTSPNATQILVEQIRTAAPGTRAQGGEEGQEGFHVLAGKSRHLGGGTEAEVRECSSSRNGATALPCARDTLPLPAPVPAVAHPELLLKGPALSLCHGSKVCLCSSC